MTKGITKQTITSIIEKNPQEKLYKTIDVAKATGASISAIQHITKEYYNLLYPITTVDFSSDKITMRKRKIKKGRGFPNEYSNGELFKLYVIVECLHIGLGKEIVILIAQFFEDIKSTDLITTYFLNEIFLINQYCLYMWFEIPRLTKEPVGGIITNIETNGYTITHNGFNGDGFDPKYFMIEQNENRKKRSPKFEGFKFCENSGSAFILDLKDIARRHYEFRTTFTKEEIAI